MSDPNAGLSRRRLFQAAAAVATALGVPVPAEAHRNRRPDRRDDEERELVLLNGLIHTMDDKRSVVDAVSIRNGRFAEVGRDARPGHVRRSSTCAA